MTNKHFITLPTQRESFLPKAISQKTWNKIKEDIQELLSDEYLPEGLSLHLNKQKGSMLIDSNVIHFVSNDIKDAPLSLKRKGNKSILKIKTNSQLYNDIIGACILVLKNHIPDATISNLRGFLGWEQSFKYYQYVLQKTAPIIFPEQAAQVSITFNWIDGIPGEDCQSTLEDIRTLLKGNAINVHVKLD